MTEPTTNTPAFDQAQITMVRDTVGASTYTRLVATFIHHTQQQLAGLQDAIANRDVESTRTVCHSLKASTLQMGCNRLAECVLAVKRAVERGSTQTLDGLMQRCLTELEHATSHLTADLNGSPN